MIYHTAAPSHSSRLSMTIPRCTRQTAECTTCTQLTVSLTAQQLKTAKMGSPPPMGIQTASLQTWRKGKPVMRSPPAAAWCCLSQRSLSRSATCITLCHCLRCVPSAVHDLAFLPSPCSGIDGCKTLSCTADLTRSTCAASSDRPHPTCSTGHCLYVVHTSPHACM